jgi:hypothetical protein
MKESRVCCYYSPIIQYVMDIKSLPLEKKKLYLEVCQVEISQIQLQPMNNLRYMY